MRSWRNGGSSVARERRVAAAAARVPDPPFAAIATPRARRRVSAWAERLGWGLLGWALAGCAATPWTPPEGCEVREPERLPLVLSAPRDLDLVFVLDDGVERSAAVARSLAHLSEMVDDLSRSDLDDDGVRDVPDWRSVRVAVLGADRGVPGLEHVAGCGDAGRRATIRGSAPSCEVPVVEGLSEGVLEFGPALAAPSDPASLGCLLAPRSACALPQPLESVLEAVSPLDPARWLGPDPPRFLDEDAREGLPGLACPAGEACPHAGLLARDLRDQRILVVIVLTERDDCSLTDPGWLDPELSLAASCARAHQLGVLRPIERYVAGLWELRPGRVIFAVQGGIPPDALTRETYDAAAIAALAADPRLEPVFEGGSIEPSCTTSEVRASPPTRLLEVAQQWSRSEGALVLGSICESGGEFASRVRRAILEAGQAPCFPPLRLSIGGHTSVLDRCVVQETLPPGARCAEREGRTRLDADAQGREICALAHVAPDATTPGWFFDDAYIERAEDEFLCLSPHLGAVRVTDASAPHGAIDVSCRYRERAGEEEDFLCDADNDEASPCREFMLCRPGQDRCGLGGTGLVCDPLQLYCARRCERDEECLPDREGRPGVCDRRSSTAAAEALGLPLWILGPEGLDEPRHICGSLDCRDP